MNVLQLRSAPHQVPRAAAATALATAASVVAHHLAGGELPALPGLVALAAVVFAGNLVFLRGWLSLRTLLPVVAATQLLSHGGLTLLAGPGGGAHAHHPPPAGGGEVLATLHLTGPMLLAHAVGTLAVAAVWVGSQRLATVVFRPPVKTVPPRHRPAPLAAQRDTRAIGDLVALVGAPRRGPPARSAA